MGNRFSSGKHAVAICDMCGFRFKLKELKPVYENDRETGMRFCPECWNADHPQNDLGKYPVEDPQAVRNPRPDTGYPQSRNFQWGWNPVGCIDNDLTPNDLKGKGSVGTVQVVIE